ncbi:ABC-type multidrug transport system ATPase component-like protein [Parafrankia sp. EAN1pec]|uniref:AAA family ATPase n=1 Tax=Parafrankia sp. (strain EAN1pec) TaxID=298653 RepID=UPI0000544D06|nr:ABC-type multidrug transport system ATPase component-like protein [Frankia sp. EAN1pec]
MRQRLGLAAALLGDPDILVLDEPMNGLDPQGIRWLRTLLRERAESGRTVLLSSHMLTEAERTVDDVIVIHRGRVAHQGPIDALVHSAVLATVLGVAIGALVRNQVLAVVGALTRMAHGPGRLPLAAAATVLIIWTVGVMAAAMAGERWRDLA